MAAFRKLPRLCLKLAMECPAKSRCTNGVTAVNRLPNQEHNKEPTVVKDSKKLGTPLELSENPDNRKLRKSLDAGCYRALGGVSSRVTCSAEKLAASRFTPSPPHPSRVNFTLHPCTKLHCGLWLCSCCCRQNIHQCCRGLR